MKHKQSWVFGLPLSDRNPTVSSTHNYLKKNSFSPQNLMKFRKSQTKLCAYCAYCNGTGEFRITVAVWQSLLLCGYSNIDCVTLPTVLQQHWLCYITDSARTAGGYKKITIFIDKQ